MKLSQGWLSASPGPLTHIPGPLFQQAMAWRFCVPSPALANLVGQPVGREGAMMDPFGDNLMCAKLPGDTWRTKHDAVKMTLGTFAHEARLPVDVEVYGAFSGDIPTAAVAEDGSLHNIRDRQGFVPDFMFRMPNSMGPPSDQLADVKGINAGRTWYGSRDKQVDKRARQVHGEYRYALRIIDAKYHHTGRGEIGPLERKLSSFGRVHGLVFGVFGEASQDLHDLLQQVTKARATFQGRM
jgi:hypothetical protein